MWTKWSLKFTHLQTEDRYKKTIEQEDGLPSETEDSKNAFTRAAYA